MPGDNKPAGAGDTVNAIVEHVDELLRQDDGVRQMERLTKHYRRIAAFEDDVRKMVRKLRRRKGVAFYTSVSGTKRQTLVVDVRIAGRSCGTIRLDAGNERLFEPRNDRAEVWKGNPEQLEWREGGVRAYLDKTAASAPTRPEAAVEAAFLVALAVRRRREKQQPLVKHQPVCIAGLPFQFPLPINARDGAEITEGSGGHADVLARASSRRLRVIEVKAPDVPESAEALRQAVVYAATLRRLLRHEPSRDSCTKILGFGTPPTKIDAVALVDESRRHQVIAAAERLNAANDHFDLAAIFYRWVEDAGRDRLEITGETRFARPGRKPRP
jgi:hypothetical protein